MKITGSAANHIFFGKKTGFEYQMMDCMKKIAVKMGDIIKEMGNHVPKSFLWHHIGLTAILTIMPLNNGTTVQAIFLLPFWNMGHNKFFLKISTKNTRALSFSLLNNSSTFDL
jgi:hypothetical protein